jgi:glycosyltransferase involved in cell wall biosynthesis
MKLWGGPRDFIREGVRLHGVCPEVPRYSAGGARGFRQVWPFSCRIYRALAGERFDLVDCNAFPYLHLLPVKLACAARKTPLVLTWQEVWGGYWYQYLGKTQGLFGRLVEDLNIRQARHIIAHTRLIRENLISAGAKAAAISLIPNGVDLAFINSCPPAADGYDIIFVGRLIREKGADLLIKAAALAKAKLGEIRCLIIGDGPEKEKLKRLAADLGLARNVFFKENLEYSEVISCLKAAKVFVFPSMREGFGIAVLEAMACGVPVITVNHPLNASRELVEESLAGVVCEPAAEAIAQEISRYLHNENLRQQAASRGREFAAGYDWDAIAAKSEELYLSVS